MVKLWRRYKPFINAGIQELITYRVNFILYRIGDVLGAFVAFYLWKAVFDSSQEPLIQGFSMADITLYIIMSFVTNLLTRSDSSFMIGEEVKDGSIIMRLLRPVHFAASYLFTELGSKWLIFITVGLPFLSVIVMMKILSGKGIVEVLGLLVIYLISLPLAYLIYFFFNFLVDMVDKGEKCPKYQAFLRQLAVNQSVNQTVNRWLFRMAVPFAGLLLP